MAQSREQLTMDMTKSENSIFSYPRGFFITRTKAVIVLLLFLVIAVAVGVVTYHVTRNAEQGLLGSSAGEADASTGKKPGKKVMDVRLPDTIKPLYYKLELIPYVEEVANFTLKGKVWIDIKAVKATDRVTIHIKNITVNKESVTITPISQAELPISRTKDVTENGGIKVEGHAFDELREFYNITVSPGLEENKIYRVYIEYTGMLDDSLGGFYRSSYQDTESNETRYIGVTQFQATDARKAFPCFDEPELKAKFEVSLARMANLTSIGNMDRKSSEPVEGMDGWMWDHYNKSVPMSTYLVAFVVSDLENRKSDPSLSKPEFRVWARKSAIEQAEYARDIGPRMLTHFENYFGIEFPLPKQDLIAIPDFGAGAMENWGLITFRESAMLYDPKASSDESKLRVATVVSHELAHQWFGNLVTPKWWNDLWLNEGFASYVEYIGVDHVSPDWKILEQFVSDEVHNVFKLDALDSSHPISVPVYHPDEISEIFDRISYAKGASIIRMMNHFLTEATFKEGLHKYLNKWTYQAAVQNDLWDSLTAQAPSDGTLDTAMTVADVMDTWTLQKGFPVIQVDRNYPDRSATFTQTKFQIKENATRAKEYESYKWWVPISYASQSENTDFQSTKPNLWLNKKDSSTTEKINADEASWVIVNVQQTGYYRVNYDERNWQLIINQLLTDPTKIHTVNRAQLLDDAFNLARAAQLDYKLAFNLTVYLKEDNEYLPWEAFLDAFMYIGQMISKSPIKGTFNAFVRDLVEKQYQQVGFTERETDPLLVKFHRVNIIRWACNVEHEDCLSKAAQLFATWMSKADPDADNPDGTDLDLNNSSLLGGSAGGGGSSALARNSWTRTSLRKSPQQNNGEAMGYRRWGSFRNAPGTKRTPPVVTSSNALANQLYRSSSFHSSGRSSAGDAEEMYSDGSLEDEVIDLTHKVHHLEEKMNVLAENQNETDDRFTREKEKNAELSTKVFMLEEQLRETELRGDEKLREEQRRFKEFQSRWDREKQLQSENYEIRVHSMEKDLSLSKTESQRFKNHLERERSEKELLSDKLIDLERELGLVREENRTLTEQGRKDREQMAVESAGAQQALMDLKKEVEGMRHFQIQNSPNSLRSLRHEDIAIENELMESQELKSRVKDYEEEIKKLRKLNKQLQDSNDELNAQLLNRGLEEGRTLLTTINSVPAGDSLAAEFEAMSQDQTALGLYADSETDLAKVKKALKEQVDVNEQLRAYIDGILLIIVENNPQLLEVKNTTPATNGGCKNDSSQSPSSSNGNVEKCQPSSPPQEEKPTNSRLNFSTGLSKISFRK